MILECQHNEFKLAMKNNFENKIFIQINPFIDALINANFPCLDLIHANTSKEIERCLMGTLELLQMRGFCDGEECNWESNFESDEAKNAFNEAIKVGENIAHCMKLF